jgi:hypothetical protein
MWGSDSESNAFSSVAWDIWDDATIQSQGGPAMRFLYPVGQFFCDSDGHKHWTWYDDYQTRWNNAVPKLKQLLMDRKILGFITGDESVDHGLSEDHLETMVNTIRATFPHGTAIIYLNDYICGRDGKRDNCIQNIPSGIDWVSSATYRDDSSGGFVQSIRDSYYEHIIPKLADHQKIGVVPMVGSAQDICDDECFAEVELQDAQDWVAWANSDDRVALIAPYLWKTFGDEIGMRDMGHADDLRDFWEDFGRGTKHEATDALSINVI